MTLALSGVSGKDVTYGYTINAGTTTATGGGVDYTLAAGVGTISAGSAGGSILFTVNNDLLDEVDELLVVTLDTDQFVNAILTGTPLENSIEDIASLFGFVNPKTISKYDFPKDVKRKIDPYIVIGVVAATGGLPIIPTSPR